MSDTSTFADSSPHSGQVLASDAAASYPQPEAAASRPSAPRPTIHGRRAPWIAAFLSSIPGLGSIYNGSYARGVAFFLSVLGLMHLAERSSEIWGFGVAFVWFFNMIDAYREARLIQAGIAHDLGATQRLPRTSPAEGIGLGVALFLIGLLAFLDATLGIDVDWVFELWPLGMMLAGAWFIVAAVLRVRQARAEAAPTTRPDHDEATSGDERTL